jgi:hypothetical protein
MRAARSLESVGKYFFFAGLLLASFQASACQAGVDQTASDQPVPSAVQQEPPMTAKQQPPPPGVPNSGEGAGVWEVRFVDGKSCRLTLSMTKAGNMSVAQAGKCGAADSRFERVAGWRGGDGRVELLDAAGVMLMTFSRMTVDSYGPANGLRGIVDVKRAIEY